MIQTYRKIFSLLDRQERRRFLLLLTMILIMSLLDVAGVASILPFLAVLADPGAIQNVQYLSVLYKGLGFSSETTFLFFLGGTVLFLVVSSLAFKTLTLYALTRFGAMRSFTISSRLLARYLGHPYAWFLGHHSAKLGTKLLSEVDRVIDYSVLPSLQLLAHSAVLIALLALLFVVDPVVMASAVVIVGGSYLLIYLAVHKLLAVLGEIRVRTNAERFKLANEAFGGIKELKLAGLESSYLGRFGLAASSLARAHAKAQVLQMMPRYLLEAVAFGGMLAIILVMLAKHDGRLQDLIPVLGVFAFAGVRMFPAVQQVYAAFTQLRFGAYSLESLHADLSGFSNTKSGHQDLDPIRLRNRLELTDIRFCYPGTDVAALDGFDLVLSANTTVGLVGGSGAGKTTLVDVILGLLIPQHGEIKVDGLAITDENRRAWQRSIGYVPQHIFLTDDTITNNIAFGIPSDQIDLLAVVRASRIAKLDQFVEQQLPQGYDTLVGERGIRLSGGQRQRIGIARALYHDPDVLIFDEATSALDNLTEQSVMDAVHNLSGAKTIILIAHRLSTVKNCDEIIFLEGGKPIGRGTYGELVRTNEQFRRLANATD
jgi:ATP-binding cassette, subfamily B, bacterial PglK